MGHLRNPEDLGLNFVLRKVVTEYDMKPVLTRPQHFWFTDRKTYIECDIDIHQFNQLGRRTFYGFM